MLRDRNDGDYNETHERAGTEPGRVKRSPLQGVECGPGLSASAEFNALLEFDFPLPPVLCGMLKKVGQGRVQHGSRTPVLVSLSPHNKIAQAEWLTQPKFISLQPRRLEALMRVFA